MKKVAAFVVLAALFALVVVHDRAAATNYKRNVGIEDVVSAQLIPGHAGEGEEILQLDLLNPNDKAVITKILSWLDSAKTVGDGKDQFASYGASQTIFSIRLKSGAVIGIEDALGSASRKLDNGGTEVRPVELPNQVTVIWNYKMLRMDSPDLKSWIQNGWQQEESFKFTPEQAIAMVLKEHPEFPARANETKTIFEHIGGKSNSMQEVTLTVTAEKSDQLSYIITLTKNYNLKINGKAAINFWKYRVNINGVTLIEKQDMTATIK